MGVLHLADLPRSLQSHPPAASVASPSAQGASYLHGVPAPEPGPSSRPLGPWPAPLPGRAGGNRQCDREEGGTEMPSPSSQRSGSFSFFSRSCPLPPAAPQEPAARPAGCQYGGCSLLWSRLVPARPPAAAAASLGRVPADSTATHRGARPQGRRQKRSSSPGVSLSSTPGLFLSCSSQVRRSLPEDKPECARGAPSTGPTRPESVLGPLRTRDANTADGVTPALPARSTRGRPADGPATVVQPPPPISHLVAGAELGDAPQTRPAGSPRRFC